MGRHNSSVTNGLFKTSDFFCKIFVKLPQFNRLFFADLVVLKKIDV
jgi:hypothetical protein